MLISHLIQLFVIGFLLFVKHLVEDAVNFAEMAHLYHPISLVNHKEPQSCEVYDR